MPAFQSLPYFHHACPGRPEAHSNNSYAMGLCLSRRSTHSLNNLYTTQSACTHIRFLASRGQPPGSCQMYRAVLHLSTVVRPCCCESPHVCCGVTWDSPSHICLGESVSRNAHAAHERSFRRRGSAHVYGCSYNPLQCRAREASTEVSNALQARRTAQRELRDASVCVPFEEERKGGRWGVVAISMLRSMTADLVSAV